MSVKWFRLLPLYLAPGMILTGLAPAIPPAAVEAVEDKNLEVAAKIAALRKADAEQDAKAAFERKDLRFLDITGFDGIAGLESWNDGLREKYGTRRIGDGFGMVLDDDLETLVKLRDSYAAGYNRSLLAHLGLKDGPAPDLSMLTPEERVSALIERLALSQEPAGEMPIFTPGPGAPKTDRRVIAHAAAVELLQIGHPAFPLLITALKDERQSASFERVKRSTVGVACRSILTEQLYALPPDYSGSFYRTGADGKSHERPVFLRHIFEEEGLGPWLNARRDKSLHELQIEALSWALAAETAIGARSPEDRERSIAPLEKRLAELKSSTVK